jgi:enamine deaminase RidA (YjgF/YER057c/UK114 family)
MCRETGTWSHAAVLDLATCSRLVFVAGQTALAEDGGIVGEAELRAQFEQVYRNLERVLAASGASFHNVVSFRTFLTREKDIAEFIALRNQRHREIYGLTDFPPNTLVVCSRLAFPALLLEIEAVAAV